MVQYNLYLESGNKSLVATLEDQQKATLEDQQKVTLEDQQKGSSHLSVIRENTDSNDDILCISTSTKLISISGTSYDIPVHLEKIECEGNTLRVIYSSEKKDFDLPTNDVFFFEHNEDQNKIIIRDAAGNGNISCEYTIHLIFKDTQANVIVYCAPKSSIYDVVLDFGSEASQMLVNRRDIKNLSLNKPIVYNVGKHFYRNEYNENERYDQQEISDNSLFRSVFFSKSPINNNSFISSQPSSDDPYLSFLTNRKSVDKGERLPNIKITQISNSGTTSNASDGDQIHRLHRGIILRFLHEAIFEITEQESTCVKDEKNSSTDLKKKEIYVNFSILVPNVMSQDEVTGLLVDLFNSLTKNVLPKYSKTVIFKGIEIRSVSESDASLMYWINTSKNVKKGQYLIVDMGKGTTDFSVVNILNGGYIESVSRSGFIGAGNALSYAIFDNYMWKLGRHDRELLIKKILRAEPALLYDLEEIIETYKKTFNPEEVNRTISKFENISEVSAEKILESIKNGGNIGDGASLVIGIVYEIIKEILIRINGLHFDYIVLAGRGFMFKPMYDMFKDFMKYKYPKAKLLDYNIKDAKKGCLQGPLSDVIVSNYSNIVGIPQTINTTEFDEKINDVSSEIDALRDKSIRKNKKAYLAIFERIIRNSGGYTSLLEKINEGMKLKSSNFSFIPSIKSYPTSSNAKIKKMMEVGLKMEKGTSIENYGADTAFYISGKKYILSNYAHLDEKQDYELYYDGKTFWIRGKKQSYQLTSDNNRNENKLLFESLFPYCLKFDKYAKIPNIKPISR